MTILHPALLIGLALVAVPVILHLLMRAKPKKLVFPALRLLQNRKKSNSRRMRLRHLGLLLLRMAVLAALVFAVARPRVPSADYALTAADWLRLAAVGGVCAALYFGGLAWFGRQRLPTHELAWRKSYLRAGSGLLALMGLIVAFLLPYRERVWASMTQPGVAVDESLPVTAVLLFDTSLSMEYLQESRTRLDVAREIAQRHLGGLPRGSRVAICDSASDAPIRFQTDLSVAIKRVAGLATAAVARPIDDRLLAAVDAHLDDQQQLESLDKDPLEPGDTTVREVYIFTDLTLAGWRREPLVRLKESLTALPSLGLYFIDVGAPEPTNVGITSLNLVEQSVPLGSELIVRAGVEGAGAALGDKTLELYLQNDAGKLVKQGAPQTVSVELGGAALTQFSLRAQTRPLLQGEVRLMASDPLTFDDVRRFTVAVHPPAEILLSADFPDDAIYVVESLAPAGLVQAGRAPFKCRVITPAQLAKEKLEKYSVVCLLNVSDPREAGWRALATYVQTGGSVFIALGDRVSHPAYLTEAARQILPGELSAPLAFRPPEFFDLQNLSHPLLKRFDDWGAAGLKSEPILRYWRVDPTRDTEVIARYTDPRQGPALIEKALGQGRVLMLTTSLDRRNWNDLPVAGWEFVGLVDQIMTYMGRGSLGIYNYIAGEEPRLPIDPAVPVSRYLLRKPGQQQLQGDVPPGVSQIIIRDADQLGNYRVLPAEAPAKFEAGFTINADGNESNLTRMTPADLDERLGKDRHSIARDIEKLRRNVQAGRQGHEMFPFVVLLLLAAFLGEHLVANRFYDSDSPQSAPAEANRAAA